MLRGGFSVDLALLLLLLVAVLAGGGGSPSPLGETVVILAAIAIVIGLAFSTNGEIGRPDRSAVALALLLPLLAVVQLVPLPPEQALSLPMREGLRAALGAAGAADAWWPLSLDSMSTLWALLALVPPMAAFLLATLVPRDRFALVLVAVALLALLSAMLGWLQLLSGGGFQIHPRSIDAGPGGLFANQNSQGDMLLIGMCAILALWFDSAPGRMAGRAMPASLVVGAVSILGLSVVLTGSRAAMVLLVVPVMLYCALFARKRWAVRSKRERLLMVATPAILLVWLALMCWQVPAMGDAVARFGIGSEARISDIWPDSIVLAGAAFPWGTGLGTFAHVFPLVERLEVIDTTYANRAHCDYLEFVIEAGIFAVAVLAIGLVTVLRSAWRKARHGMNAADLWAGSALAIVAAHSLVDYPLRSISLAVIAAIALGRFITDQGDHSHV
ncbi:O-antigen ligase family protein [Croceicoccus bisphenolivorans]|uniref:O-antigen ligase family protein n=1 Tax=Croceicoccus bisphenolivorans TaxID=1783232 RepID=UPI00082E98C8|nr:O-antigen ligase family protein [Croceicoccus bisphenolivorans]